ncbi:MAG: TetR/AcrR family transcriptional regulator [Pseudonocardia sp.]
MARTRKSIATHAQIASAALGLAEAKGPSAVTAQDIASAAHVSLRTVYNHFPSVAHAILGVDPDAPDRMAERLAARPADEPPLRALAAAAIEPGGGPARWRVRSVLARTDPVLHTTYLASFNAIDDRLVVAMAQRLGRDPDTDIYPRLLVTVCQSAMRIATEFAIEHAPPDHTEEQVVDLILRTIEDAVVQLEQGMPASVAPRGHPPAGWLVLHPVA